MFAPDSDVAALAERLAAPFNPAEIKFKPTMVKNNRCLALAYIDARLICDRLDEVLGVANWKDDYNVLHNGSVQCVLSCRFGSEWVSKQDVGSMSEQPDDGDRLKAAFSDALKRAAVKFGIGRYLYRLGQSWVDYDPARKMIVAPPQLPAWALPSKRAAEPETGPELMERLAVYEAKMVASKACDPGFILKSVAALVAALGAHPDPKTWPPSVVRVVTQAVQVCLKSLNK